MVEGVACAVLASIALAAVVCVVLASTALVAVESAALASIVPEASRVAT